MSADESERELIAAEYALRLLDRRDLDQARALAASDPVFARQIAEWNERFAPMFDGIEPIEPDAAVWERIEAAIGRGQADGAEIIELRRRVKIRTNWAVAASTIAAALALVLLPNLVRPERSEPPVATAPAAPALLAKVVAEDRSTAFVVSFEPARAELVVTPAVASAADGRVHELWLIGASGVPASLGLIDEIVPTRLKVAPAQLAEFKRDATLAVTVEPEGGSPTGQPTSAPIAAGPLIAI